MTDQNSAQDAQSAKDIADLDPKDVRPSEADSVKGGTFNQMETLSSNVQKKQANTTASVIRNVGG